ncbi:MAG: YpdA family putative bacillithiol disulfide reductase [Gemmatimonadales bacterium]|nr:MAG: YpdA family putative bacillithiol disulfide reductase [Gemmatimonadales bacterium]
MSHPDSLSGPVDFAIIGAGPCGIAAGAAARRAGLDVVVVDQGPLCDSIVRYPYYMTFFSTPEKLEIEGLPFVTTDKTPTRKEALVYFRRVTEYFELDTRLYEKVEGIEGSMGDFRIRTRATLEGADAPSRTLRACRIVVATGGFHGPNLLNVPGEELPKVRHHYTEAHPYWNQDVVVVGGSNSAVEASLEMYRAGVRVTLVHFAEELDRSVKPWVRPDMLNRIEKGEIAARFGHRVSRIEPGRVTLRRESDGATASIANDFVLALTGWKADPVLLRELGVPVDEQTGVPAHDPETMETPVPGVYIAGVLAAGHDANRIFIENGRWHGRRIVDSIPAAHVR